MKSALLLSVGLFIGNMLFAQESKNVIFDTLIVERFENDPTANMLNIPSGNDQQWVNYDYDGFVGDCVKNGATPNAWYWEKDLSSDTIDNNSCYTSCSFVKNEFGVDFPCANWLILPPVAIADSSCILSWKSQPSLGPAFLDGYQVLISTTSNDIFSGVFTDTLFSAASMISCPNVDECGSLIPSEYNMTPGYIHANGFTNQNYFYYFPPFQSYRGRLEPHTVNLSKYAGKVVYIAFLHDSNNNYLLQLDDILVVDQKTSGAQEAYNITKRFSTFPNPATTTLQASWTLKNEAAAQLEVRDMAGHLVHSASLPEQTNFNYEMNTEKLPSGTYFMTIYTKDGVATHRFVKI